jgi:hypothetical protein
MGWIIISHSLSAESLHTMNISNTFSPSHRIKKRFYSSIKWNFLQRFLVKRQNTEDTLFDGCWMRNKISQSVTPIRGKQRNGWSSEVIKCQNHFTTFSIVKILLVLQCSRLQFALVLFIGKKKVLLCCSDEIITIVNVGKEPDLGGVAKNLCN